MTAKERILIVSDEARGGAAVACRRLRDWLRKDGRYDCMWLAGEGGVQQPDVMAEARRGVDGVIIRRLAERVLPLVPGRVRLRKRLWTWCNDRELARCVYRHNPSLVHLHNLHEYASIRFVEKIDPRLPIVWTLQDMWLLTGYCLHTFGCEQYVTGCRGACKELGRWGMAVKDPSAVWRRTDRFFRGSVNRRVVLVSPSRWLYRHARARFKDTVRMEHIPYGVDLAVFHPVDRAAARAALGLPSDGKVVLTGAVWLESKLKGIEFGLNALQRLQARTAERVTVVGFGDAGAGLVPKGWIACGRIYDERLLNLYLAAADVFLMPSLAENFSKALLEALAAGTPSVCFDVGGCAEIVRNGQTGFCVPSGDGARLLEALTAMTSMEPEAQHAMRAQCRAVAEAEYSSQCQVARYVALYEELLGTRKPAGETRMNMAAT